MTKELIQLLVWHCSATPEGRVHTSKDVFIWHLMPCDYKDGTVQYMGKRYKNRAELFKLLPNETIQGVSIHKGKGRGWRVPGYRDIILLDGSRHRLTQGDNEDQFIDPWEITNGVAGINRYARHAMYIGGLDKSLKPKDTRNELQLNEMRKYTWAFLQKVPTARIAGHYHFDTKACPSFDVEKWCYNIGVPEHQIYRKNK